MDRHLFRGTLEGLGAARRRRGSRQSLLPLSVLVMGPTRAGEQGDERAAAAESPSTKKSATDETLH